MDLGLAGQNCVIAGASRGIGLAIARGLAAEGANLAICARQDEALQDAAAELRQRGGTVYAARCDIGDHAALEAFLDAARQALGGVQVFVHNASALAVGPDAAAWEASLQVDLLAAVRACDRVVPWMREAGGGSVLFVSSISAFEASPMRDYAYTAVKAALNAYAKKLALTEAAHGIRANVLAPGSIEFADGIWARVRQHQPDLYAAVRATIPWGRMGRAEEVADAAVYLLSRRASWITGVTLAVDGGQHKGIR